MASIIRKVVTLAFVVLLVLSALSILVGGVVYADRDDGRYTTLNSSDDGCTAYIHYENGTVEELDSTDDLSACEQLEERAPSNESEAQEALEERQAFGVLLSVGGVVGTGISLVTLWKLGPIYSENNE